MKRDSFSGILRKCHIGKPLRERMINFVYALLFSVAVLLSVKMPTDFVRVSWLGLSIEDFFLFAAILLASYGIISAADLFVREKNCRTLKDECGELENSFFLKPAVVFVFIIIAWLPFFLSFYPGNLSPDSYSSIDQALKTIRSNANPVLFTLFVRVALRTGLALFRNMNAAVAVYSILQMLILDGILTYTVLWMKRHQASRIFLALTIVYFALNPLIVRYSFTMWKDILFSGTVLLFLLLLYDIAMGEKRINETGILCRFLFLSVLIAFLRNRLIYAVIAVFVLLLILYRSCWKKLLPAFLLTVVAVLMIQGPVFSWLNIKQSNYTEGQGVSLQQLAAVLIEDGDISEKELEFVNRMMPLEDIKEAYRPHSVDNIKAYGTLDNEFLNSHKAEYRKVWRSVFLKNPWICMKAWLMTTRGFWGFGMYIEPFAITWPNEELGISQVNVIKQVAGIDLEYLSNGFLVHIEDIPAVRRLFEMGCLGWFGLFVMIQAIKRKKYKQLIPLAQLNLLWIVICFTTPLNFEPRYMFAYNLALPWLIWMLMYSE